MGEIVLNIWSLLSYIYSMEASQQIHMLLLDKSPVPSCWDKLRCCFHARSRDDKRQSNQKKMTVTFDDDCEIFKDNYDEEEDDIE